jgi:hypothetical protein
MTLDHSRHRLITGGYRAAVVALLVLGASTACTSSPSPSPSPKPSPVGKPGVVVGDAPICYGPGPNLNLRPHITVRATPTDGGSPTTIHIATSDKHHSYRMTLPPGTYKISTYSGSVNVTGACQNVCVSDVARR